MVHDGDVRGADEPDVVRVRRDLHETREQFAATSEVLGSLGRSASNNDVVLDTLVRSVCRLCRADAATLYLAAGPGYRLARSAGLSAEFVEHIGRHPLAADRRTLVGRVGLDRRTQQIADVLSDPDYGRHDTQRIGGFRTIVGAPMLFDAKVVGVLSVWRTDVEPFDDRANDAADDVRRAGRDRDHRCRIGPRPGDRDPHRRTRSQGRSTAGAGCGDRGREFQP